MNDSDLDQDNYMQKRRRFTNPATKTSKSQAKNTRKKKLKPDDQRAYLMPEMDEFIDNKIDRQNYLTQDEATG